jgi:hypothetical protein
MPTGFNIRNSDGKFQVDDQGRFYFDDHCCCTSGTVGDCWLLRVCAAQVFHDPNVSCSTTGNLSDLPVVVAATINLVTRNLLLNVNYGLAYGDVGGVCASQQGLDEWYLQWTDNASPPDGTGQWTLTDQTNGIYLDGPSDTPCDPTGNYSDGLGNTGYVEANNAEPCEYLCEGDYVVSGDLSIEFFAGKIIQLELSESLSACYDIVCNYPCDDGLSGSLYSPTPLSNYNWRAFDTCQECIPVPCECPNGLSGDYRIAGYVPGDLTACAECTESLNPAWDGVFHYNSSPCYWEETDAASIDGTGLIASLYLETGSNPDCYWEISINCTDDDVNPYPVWVGTKDYGTDPVGVYTRTAGCDMTSSLTIEEVP